MNIIFLPIVDKFLIIFHTAIILFNLFGFLFKKTRVANLVCLSITAFSWFILGIWHGFGYCFLVDWHWSIRHKLGYFDNPDSYIKFLLDNFTGLNFNEEFVNIITAVLFFSAFTASLLLNLKDYKERHKKY